MKRFILSISLLTLTYLWLIGTFSSPKSWQQTSGYILIPEKNKPNFYRPKDATYPDIFWLGHGGHLIQWHGLNILLDPILSNSVTIIPRLSPAPIKAEELPAIDYVLLSHMHYDHYDKDTIEKIKVLKKLVIPNSSEVFISDLIKTKAELLPLRENEHYKNGELEIISLRTLHNGARNHPFSSEYRASAYLLKMGEISIYFSGDTGYGPQFHEVREKYAPNISILPIGAYEPYFILHKYHLSPEDAVKAGLELGSEITIPTHFGTFRIALDRPEIALPGFVKDAKKHNLRVAIARSYSH